MVVDKTWKRVYMCVFSTWIAILSFIFGKPLNFVQEKTNFETILINFDIINFETILHVGLHYF